MARRASPLENIWNWGRLSFKRRPKFEKKALCLVIIDDDLIPMQRQNLDAALAFSTIKEELKFVKISEVPVDNGPSILMKYLTEIAPIRVLIATGRKVSELETTLLFLSIAHMKLPFHLLSEQGLDPNQIVPDRGQIREVVGRRTCVYIHAPNAKNLDVFTAVYAEARRQFPDLLVLLRGLDEDRVKLIPEEFVVVPKDTSKARRQLADFIYEVNDEYSAQWASVANVCLFFPENKQVEEWAKLALGSGAAVVTFGLKIDKSKMLSELEAIGAIWTVQNQNLLSAALTQALSPEKSALTVFQSLEHINDFESNLSKEIDRFLEMA